MTLRTLAIAAATIAVATAGPALAGHKTDALLAAGFVDRPASTPARQQMLARLPNKKFVRRVRGDKVTYVYADAKGCDCLYVGTQQAYGAWQRHRQRQNIADQQEMAASDFNDPGWNWGAWGPGPGAWGGFGFGPGLGW